MTVDCFIKHSEPFETHHFRDGSGHCAIVRIGRDPVRDLYYSAFLAFDTVAGHPNDQLEFVFCIIEADEYGTENRRIWSGLETKHLFKHEDRATILAAVLTALKQLISNTKPKSVYRCTRDAHAPDKAGIKHIRIARVFESCGYVVRTADPYGGRVVWWMDLAEQAASNF